MAESSDPRMCVEKIWDRLVDSDVTQIEESLRFLMEGLKELVDADDAVWIGVVRMVHGEAAGRDSQLGWRGRVVVHLEWTDLKREVVAWALRPLKWFHRATMLIHGVMLGDSRLTPREISLCQRLLGVQSEKQIAEFLGLKQTTVRSFIQALYKKFGVQGRTGLMALWLGTPR